MIKNLIFVIQCIPASLYYRDAVFQGHGHLGTEMVLRHF